MRNEYIHLLKTFTWRILGTFDTVALVWLFTGDPFTGIKIGFLELLSKVVLYYLHERGWSIRFTLPPVQRRLLKTLTWRIIGTVDTIFIALVITQNLQLAIKIALAEVLTKMLLYYFHEWSWEQFPLEPSASRQRMVPK